MDTDLAKLSEYFFFIKSSLIGGDIASRCVVGVANSPPEVQRTVVIGEDPFVLGAAAADWLVFEPFVCQDSSMCATSRNPPRNFALPLQLSRPSYA